MRMSKRNIYLVQVDILRKTPTFYTAYLPYASGELWAYAKQAPAVAEGYALRDLFFLRDPVEDAAGRMEHPFLVGFSCYCWNMEYNKALAQAVKRRHPGCHILFGGHQIPPGGVLLEQLPYVDFLVHGEGEIPFRALLAQLGETAPDLAAVPGLSYRTGRGTAENAEVKPQSIVDFPSPYLEGVLDPIVARHPEIQWCTVWETNRGCPHRCSYCDWGLHETRLRVFSMERLMAEIEWFGRNKVEFILCADANFGILSRDEELLDALIATNIRTQYPKVVFCNTTKALNERLFRIIEKLHRSGLNKAGPSFAVQSLSPTVLHNIGRKNIDEKVFAEWIRRCHSAGYRTHTDLILPLPGETLQSFCLGVEKLFALGQHGGIQCFLCDLLPNAPMAAPDYQKKHGIRTVRKIAKQNMENEPENDPIDEFTDMVVETATMPHADWLTANYFIRLVTGLHGFGALRLAAIVLHTEKVATYAAFYLRLLAYCGDCPASLPGEIMSRLRANVADYTCGEEPQPLEIPGFSFGRMYEDQYVFCRAVLEPDRFFHDAATFLRQFGCDAQFISQLLSYQRESILLPGCAAEKTLSFDYDFPAYFDAVYDRNPVPLQKKAVRLRFSSRYDVSSAEKYYDYVVRRGRFSNDAFYQTQYLPF